MAATFGFVSGLGTAYGTLYWIFEVPGFGLQHSLLAASYLALYPACWCLGVSLMSRTGGEPAFPAAALWVLLDYLRAHAGFLAFPWGTLAQTQHGNLAVLQTATLTGEYGVTFLVVLGNTALAGVLLQRAWQQAMAVLLVVATLHGAGLFILHDPSPDSTIRLAAVQPNIQRGEQDTPEGRIASFERLERLTRAAAAHHPSLIAWPETAIAGNLQANPLLAADLQSLAQEAGTPIVLGVSEVEKFASRDATGTSRRRTYNSAYLVSPAEPLSPPYRKRLLVPFGEYVPLETMVPWPAWMGGKGFDSEPGRAARFFNLPDGTLFAVMICWESLFSDLSRESVQGGARLLAQLNNPAWFGRTAAAKQQNISAVLRAVENRVPVLLSSNTGPSQIIDPYGRVVAGSRNVFAPDMAVGEVPLGNGGTIYTRAGDLLVLFLLCGVALTTFYRNPRQGHSADSSAGNPSSPTKTSIGYKEVLMNLLWLLTLLSWLFLTVAVPHHVSASGYILDLGPDNFCYKKAPQKVTFAPPPFTYVFTGTCNMLHTRAQLPVDVPWTVVGTYDPATGRTTEDINVPPPAISQPSRPYGRFLATMHCAADPWRDPRVLCDQISASANPPATAYPPNAWGNYSRELVTQIINSINSYRRPYSGEMEDPHRQFLNAQFQAFEAGQRKEQQLLHGSKKSGDLAFSATPPPLIASPKPGQTFPAQTTVPIKLVPPGGWTVTGYVVTIQRKDPNGNWVAHATIPVSAAVAQTGSGYTGFGGGAPPAFLMLPGRWRLNAQASSPKKSGITEWVEFTATTNTLRSKKLTPFFTP